MPGSEAVAIQDEFDEPPSPCGSTLSEASLASTVSPPQSPKKRGQWRPAEPTLEEDLPLEEQERIAAAYARPRRSAISDCPIDMGDVESYVKKVHEKDSSTVEELLGLFSKNKALEIFSHLKGEHLMDVINALYSREYVKGDDIIIEGDDGDCLYLINEGSVDIFVRREGDDGKQEGSDKGPKVATWEKGAIFGELALLYNCPRAATVTAASDKVGVWVLDEHDFKMLIIQGRQAEYTKYEGWLQHVDLFKTLNHFELSTLAEALKVHNFRKGTEIIKQDDVGDRFFILSSGTAAAYMAGEDGEKEVKKYTAQGDYFGELSLLQPTKRLATVRCLEDCVVVSLSKQQFSNLLGPLIEKLKKNAESYPQYADFLNKA